MKHAILFFLCLFSVNQISSQDYIKDIEAINSFIRKNSDGYKNYWAKLMVENNNLIIYNTSDRRVGKLSFPISKIDYNKISVSSKKLVLKPNEAGSHVTFTVINDRKIPNAQIEIHGMSKKSKKELKSMIYNFVKNYQNSNKETDVSKATINTSDDIYNINKAITNLFLNFELTNRNYNLSTIFDYTPIINENNVETIEIKSNLGHNKENIEFIYNSKNELTDINYIVDKDNGKGDILYKYQLIYSNNFLKSINIKGNKKYTFKYKNKLVSSITYSLNDIVYIYNVDYSSNLSSANLKLDVIRNGKTYYFTNKNSLAKIEWNNKYLITSYSLDIYGAYDVSYDEFGNMVSFSFSSSRPDRTANWIQILDNKNNWTTRKIKETVVERKINYK